MKSVEVGDKVEVRIYNIGYGDEWVPEWCEARVNCVEPLGIGVTFLDGGEQMIPNGAQAWRKVK